MPSEKQPKYLYLTTRGRKTGLPREIEIWFTTHDQKYYVMAEYPTSHWIQNLRVDPRVQLRVGEQTFPACARVVLTEHEADLWHTVQRLFREKYGWGEGSLVELVPTDS